MIHQKIELLMQQNLKQIDHKENKKIGILEKKKQHTIKTQIEIGSETLLIYSIRFAKGSTHDYKLFKELITNYNNDDEKWYNNEISKVRIAIEHVNAFIKKFKITSTRYRNRRKNFKLYMSLICGIYNFETANLQFTDRPNIKM